MVHSIKNIFAIICLAVLSVGFVACSAKETDSTKENEGKSFDAETISNVLIQGSWEVTNYTVDDSNLTADYDPYTFVFNSAGPLAATDGGSTSLSGAWSFSGANVEGTTIDLNLFFSSPELFAQITNSWSVVDFTDTTLELSKENTEESTITYLTFTKM